jgi:DNA-binding response OmpR family regulator
MTTEKVLIVEDDPHLLRFVEDALRIADYEVRSAGDGEEALAVLARWRPHVILLDLNMPRMDGWEFCATRLSRGELASIPVVIMSSPDNLATGPRPLVKPVARLQKPFDMSELLSTVWAAANGAANPSSGTP